MAERVLDVGALIESRPIGSAQWTVIGLCAFVPLIPMLVTGLYMFALPYLGKGGVRAGAGSPAR